MTPNDPHFPLGQPVNRKIGPDFVPIANRPGWWRDVKTGVETYRDPPKMPEKKANE